MHEWALARAVVSTVIKVAAEAGASGVKSVEVAVGELQELDENAMLLAIGELSRKTILEGAKWKFAKVEAAFRCRRCGEEWKMDRKKLDPDEAEAIHFIPEVAHAFIRCPSCGGPDFEITGGRGIWVERIEVSE
ncbi:MAG: hydrogenase nickel incorporation protein HypA [Candidatus Hadarchaeales archaeon]